MAKTQGAPRFGPAGAKLRATVLKTFELDPHEEALLDELCRTADVMAALQAQIDKDGPLVKKTLQGPWCPHPALVELRHQRATLIRLTRALKLPAGVVEGPGSGRGPGKVRHGFRELRAAAREGSGVA